MLHFLLSVYRSLHLFNFLNSHRYIFCITTDNKTDSITEYVWNVIDMVHLIHMIRDAHASGMKHLVHMIRAFLCMTYGMRYVEQVIRYQVSSTVHSTE